MYLLAYCSIYIFYFIYPDYELLMIHPLSKYKSPSEEILCLCDYSPPPLVSTLMTYRAPLAGLLTSAAVTYVYWGGAGVILVIIYAL